ncbi:magnesium transporter [Chachezhania sediminis]|uniref:magnesium transporter n=1 Tax=Chachezhania sediminis TaxID=2599291 RepID=UPI00131E04E5|nr:magnesium transporter [Chachezhania sediminis]
MTSTETDQPLPDTALELALPQPRTVPIGATCAEATALMSEGSAGEPTVICVLAEDGRLVGIATLRDCLKAPADAPVDRAMTARPPVARADWDAEDAARLMLDRDLSLLPVVDGAGKLLGVVTPRRAYRHLLGQAEDDAQDFAGVIPIVEDDYGAMSITADFLRRAPWVLVLAVAGLAAGYVVHVYEDALDALVILALYMPMVADTGGNVGTQSSSLVTRAIGSGIVDMRGWARVLWREARVSLMMAAALFLFAYLKVLLISNPQDVPMGLTIGQIAIAIGTALAVQVVSATMIGAILPLGAVAARLDPAVVSGPALTTIVDLTGLMLYFFITTHMLGLYAGF